MTKELFFTVEPGFVVEHARGLVLSEDWRGALAFLMDGMEGMTLDIAVAILKGERTISDDADGMTEGPQDPDDARLKRYLETAAWQTAGIYESRGEFYQPYGTIEGFGREDKAYARDHLERMGNEGVTLDEYRVLRAKYHMYSRESDLVFFGLQDTAVLFKRVQGPAFWVETFKDAKKALAAFKERRSFRWLGEATSDAGDRYCQPKCWEFYEDAIREGVVYASSGSDELLDRPTQAILDRLTKLADSIAEAKALDAADAAARSATQGKKKARFFQTRPPTRVAEEDYEVEVLRLRIAQQAERFGGYLELLVREDSGDRMVKVPAAPFLNWASRSTSMDTHSALPKWPPVSPSGMKMGGDNPHHTDWWLGAGLPLRAAYDMDHPVNKAAWRFATGLARGEGHDCVRLAGEGTVFGQVVFPKPNEAVPEGSIAVVPYAGVDYEIAMLSACKGGRGAVVSAVGGKLAHLATVGRETSCRVLVVDDAMTAFKEGQFVTINLDRLTVKRHETYLSTLDPFDM
jgi:phosphohistidine swiveling domain-containing protein